MASGLSWAQVGCSPATSLRPRPQGTVPALFFTVAAEEGSTASGCAKITWQDF